MDLLEFIICVRRPYCEFNCSEDLVILFFPAALGREGRPPRTADDGLVLGVLGPRGGGGLDLAKWLGGTGRRPAARNSCPLGEPKALHPRQAMDASPALAGRRELVPSGAGRLGD